MRVWYLKPTGPCQVTGGSLGGAIPRSDTLSAALLSLWDQVDRSVDIASLAARPPFRVSSGLPWLQGSGGTRRLFYPVPAGATLRLGRRFPDQHKVARRIEFATARAHASILSERVSEIDRQLQFWTSSGRLLVDLADSFDDASVAHSTPFTWTETRPRLEVDRLTNGPVSGLLFDSSRHRFVAKGGWSLAAEIERGAEGRFVGALNLLGHQGVGQDRTVGQGGFEVVGTEELPDDVLIRPQDGRKPPKAARMLLSLCHPTPEDVRNGILHGAYVLTERAGWVTNAGRTSLRRAAVTMMAEGSWYPNDAGTSPGDVVKALDPLPDEGLDHPVYRDGRGLTVQVSAGEELR